MELPNKVARWIPLWLILAVGAALGGVVGNDFVGFDDGAYILHNQVVRSGLTLEGVKWAFATMRVANWHPLTWLSHMLDCQVWGINPAGHHLTSLLIHLIDVLLVFWVLKRISFDLWRSALVALLFGIHPMHVESVAWISERKDVLSALFGLLSIGCHVEWRARRGFAARSFPPEWSRWYGGSFLFLALGLLCKPMLVTWPAVLWMVDFWIFRRADRVGRFPTLRTALEKAPHAVLVVVSSWITLRAQQGGGAVWSLRSLSIWGRIFHAGVGYCAYVFQLAWPARLAILYPIRPIPAALGVITWGLLGLLTWLLGRKRNTSPELFIGWVWFLVTLLPVIGLVQVGVQWIADRYTYLPSIGLFISLAWGLPALGHRGWRQVELATTLAMIAILAVLCRRQVEVWSSTETLFGHELAIFPDEPGSRLVIAELREEAGDIPTAEATYREIVRTHGIAEAHAKLGRLLLRKRKPEEALIYLEKGARLAPHQAELRQDLGVALVQLGRVDEGLKQLWVVRNAEPTYEGVEHNLGVAYLAKGDPAEAAIHLRRAVALNPMDASSHFVLGKALWRLKRYDESLGELGLALRIKPEDAATQRLWRRVVEDRAASR